MGDNPIIGGEFGYSPGEIFANPLAPGLGKPSGAQKAAQVEALQNASFMPRALWNTTAPIRSNITNQLTNFTKGNFDISKMPAYAPGKNAIESTYRTARDQTIADTPAGGLLYDELTNLSAERARDLSDVVGGIQADLLNKAYGAGYGTPQVSIAGANQAAGNLNSYMAAQQTQANQQAIGIGELIGTIATK